MRSKYLALIVLAIVAGAVSYMVVKQHFQNPALTKIQQPSNSTKTEDKKLTVINPNGGEKFKIGASYSVSWKVGKTTPQNKVWIAIKGENPNKCRTSNGGVICDQPIVYTIAKEVNNTEKFSWLINKDIRGLSIEPGKYKLMISLPKDSMTVLEEDESDNFFDIAR